MVGTEFAVEPLLERHAGAFARVHREVCPYYPSSKLGLGFCRSFYRMYASTPDAFGFGAWRGQEVVGLVIGCPRHVQESLQRQLRGWAAWALLLRPWLLFKQVVRWRKATTHTSRQRAQGQRPTQVTEPARLIRLVNIGVISDVRRLGVASALIQAFLAESGRRGYTLVELNVAPDNATARRFYERHGWHCDDTATPPGSENLRYVIATGDRTGGDVPCPPPAT